MMIMVRMIMMMVNVMTMAMGPIISSTLKHYGTIFTFQQLDNISSGHCRHPFIAIIDMILP